MSDQLQINPLTEREAEILTYLAEGLTNSDIADRLFLAPSTVKWYVTQLNRKLNTANRDEIVERAQQLRLVESQAPAAAPKHNLPHPPTPFIGREAELDELYRLLTDPDVRLLTILALGGMGKTRVALEAARQQLGNFPDGVYFVPLADVDQIVLAIAEHTGYQFRQDHGHDPERQILDYLRNKHMLLLLDNFEHLLDHAPLVTGILEAAPGVKVLATSREKLNLSAETIYALHGLPYPDWETPADALQYDAVQLLVQAAQRVKPEWAVTAENLDYVARICRLTEGMPLGILLAASWLDVFTLEHITAEIQNNVDFLETEMRDVSPRQRSIRAVFESSWNYLRPEDQATFMKLSVFRGGCTPAAAEAVTGANPRILQALVNKALLTHTQPNRYELHELLRQYGADRLEQSGRADETYAAHSAYYCDLLQNLADDLKGRRQLGALEELDQDYKNVHAAWLWAAKHGSFNHLTQALFSMQFYLSVRGPHTESLHGLTQTCAYLRDLPLSAERDYALAHVLAVTSLFHTLLSQNDEAQRLLDESGTLLGDNSTAYDRAKLAYFRVVAYGGNCEPVRPLLEEAVSAFREVDDAWWKATILSGWGNSLVWNFHPIEGKQYLEEARQIQEELGERFGLANTLLWLSQDAEHNHYYAEARRLTLCALEHYRELRSPFGIYRSLKSLGALAEEVGDFVVARQHYEESLALALETGNQVDSMYQSWSLSFVALAQGTYDEAAELCERAVRYFQAHAQSMSSIILIRAGEIAIAQGKLDAARVYLEQGRQLAEANDYAINIAFCLRGLGKVAHCKGHYEQARTLLDEALETLTNSRSAGPDAGPYKQMELITIWAALADLAITVGDFEVAAQHLKMALSLNPQSPRVPMILTAVASAAMLLAAQSRFGHAAQLAAFIEQHPSAFAVDKDKVTPLRERLAAELGEDAYRAAGERGRSLDLETAIRLTVAG